jgi:hypothetical protein
MPRPRTRVLRSRTALIFLSLVTLATFFFQAGNMVVFAYVIRLGKADGLMMDFISPVPAAASWTGIAGSGLVILLSTRFGRAWPLPGSRAHRLSFSTSRSRPRSCATTRAVP